MKDITAHQNMQQWQTITDTVVLIGGRFDFSIVGNKLNQTTARLALKNLKVTRLKTTHFVPSNNYEKSNVAYRYGFNGMERDDEVKGAGNSLDFGARMYDSRLGRWLSLDPLAHEREWLTPYNFVQNNPILRIDPNGMLDDVFEEQDDGSFECVEKNDNVVDEYRYKDGSVQYSNKQTGVMSKKVNNQTGEVQDTPQNAPREFNMVESYSKFRETTRGEAFESTLNNFIILTTLPISGMGIIKAPSAIEKIGATMSFLNGADDLTANFSESGKTVIQNGFGSVAGNFTKGVLGLGGVTGGVYGLTKIPYKPSSTSPIDNMIGIGGDFKSTIEGFIKSNQ